MEKYDEFPYIGIDGRGYRYNTAYPPDNIREGWGYNGYRNNARGVLFYDFAVMGYDVEFLFAGKRYYLLYEKDHAALCDSRFSTEFERFDNPVSLIENLRIGGSRLIDIIDNLEEVEPM